MAGRARMRFKNRQEAGVSLAKKLNNYRGQSAVVYALPRGGVVLGAEISQHLNLPLDLLIPRKIGHPLYPEYAIGAVTEDGQVILNYEEASRHDSKWLKRAVLGEVEEARRRRSLYLKGRARTNVENKVAIIVDDGIATGLTMQAALREVKSKHPAKIVLAIPVLPTNVAHQLEKESDEIVALDIPRHYAGSVGAYYDEFKQVEDAEVIDCLGKLKKLSSR